MLQPLIIQCSPRPHGNSAYAAELVRNCIQRHYADNAQELGAEGVKVIRLCDYAISPCIGCDICAIPKSYRSFFLGCPLSKHDESETVLAALLQASPLYFISPIYHYHLPAQAKAVLDRLQPFYWMELGKVPYPPDFIRGRHQVSILVAGQPRGEQLFHGSMLSLRYSLRSIGFEYEDSLGLRGLDAQNDLRANPVAQERITEIVSRTLNRQTSGLSGYGAP